MNNELALPTTTDIRQWNADERSLMEAAGLLSYNSRGDEIIADRGTVAAFLMICQKTQLDPFAKQIYCIKRGQKWVTQISIDGARLIAERSGKHQGPTDTEWSDDGVTWTKAWVRTEENPYPEFARAGVYREGFRKATKVVARWGAYAVYNDEWVNNKKTGRKVLGDTWEKMPDLMLAKCAEMLALRKSFPMDLSGLYIDVEMGNADKPRETPEPRVSVATLTGRAKPAKAAEPQPDWDEFLASGVAYVTKDDFRRMWKEAQRLGAPDHVFTQIKEWQTNCQEAAESPVEPVLIADADDVAWLDGDVAA
ncbi:MAG: phage recombination protein Bet [Promicromonosporaceae bacterium]|nr:phage recombination protein Bet [Promicromonosporaceae bacterium]